MAEGSVKGAEQEAAPRRRGPQTREQIRRAAVDLFAELGYHATSIRQISDAAGVRVATIYHWYDSKEALLIELQDDFLDQLTGKVDAAVARQTNPAFRLAAAVREHVAFHGICQQWAFVADSEIRALSDRPRNALIAKRDAYQSNFAAMITAGVDGGLLHSPETKVATYAILLQCTGVDVWFDPKGRLSLDEVARVQVQLILSSLQASPQLIAEAVESVCLPSARFPG